MRISLVIPTLWVNNVIYKMLESVKGQCHEIIIVDDQNASLAQKINRGINATDGDLIIISNDDVVLSKGRLEDLHDTNNVVSPKVIGGIDKLFHAHMFAMTKKQFKEVGYFDEEFPNAYWIDSDYWMRIKQCGYGPIKNNDVVILHEHPANTLNAINENTNLGKHRFIEKWGEQALQVVR